MTDARFQKNAKIVIRTGQGFQFARFQSPIRGGGYLVERVRDGLPLIVEAIANPFDLPTSAIVDGMSLSSAGY